MSLIARFHATVFALLLAAFAVSYFISARSAREALVQQFTVKNLDNATALALSLSQIEKDPVTQGLLVSAQFDTGHYRYIRLRSVDGQDIVNKVYEGPGPKVPSWFESWMNLEIAPGVATVQDGWKQLGTVTLATHEQFALETLWAGVKTLLGWFLLGLVFAWGAGYWLVQRVTQPLSRMVAQARSLAQRRFEQVPVPPERELKEVAQALNTAVGSVQTMFTEEARQLDELHQRLNHDPLTGLAVRDRFLSLLREALDSEHRAPVGSLLVLHFEDLGDLNLQLGRTVVDEVLRRTAGALRQVVQAQGLNGAQGQGQELAAGRLNASDFALLLPGQEDPEPLAQQLTRAVIDQLLGLDTPHRPLLLIAFRVGGAQYRSAEPWSAVLTRADEAVTRAAPGQAHSLKATGPGAPRLQLGLQTWRELLNAALVQPEGLQLERYPVRRLADGGLLHEEAYTRIDLAAVTAAQPRLKSLFTAVDGGRLSGGEFIGAAARLGLGSAVDLRAVELALAAGGSPTIPVALNLSTDCLTGLAFRQGLRRLLKAHPGAGAGLLFEASALDIQRHPAAFQELALSLQQLGVRVGLDFFGLQLDAGLRLESLGLSHLKMHPSLLQGLAESEAHQELWRRLCAAAAALGVAVMATGVRTEAEQVLLASLGVQGVAGPGVR